MKKVRLFAVAAALGMLAATVNAAEAVKYVPTWNNVPEGEVIRAEFGGNIVAPQITADVMKYTASNTGNASKVCTKPDGTTAIDANLDGIADQAFYKLSNNVTSSFWYYSNAKFVPTPTTMKYYTGMTKNAPGGRILAPGQEAQQGIVNGANHKFVSFNDAAGIDAILADALVNGGAKVTEDADGFVKYTLGTTTVDAYAPRAFRNPNNAYAWETDANTLVKYVQSSVETFIDANYYGGKVARANEDAKAEMLNYITGLNTEDGERRTVTVNYFNKNDVEMNDNGGAKVKWTAAIDGENAYSVYVKGERDANGVLLPANLAKPARTGAIAYDAAPGVSLVVYSVDKRGELVEHAIVSTTTGEDFLRGTKVVPSRPISGTIPAVAGTDLKDSIIIVNDTRNIGTGGAVASLDSLDITILSQSAERGNVKSYDKVWDADNEEFVKVTRTSGQAVRATDIVTFANFNEATTNALIDRFGGYYSVNTPKNSSNQYVVDYSLGAYPFDSKLGGTLSKAKMTLTYTTAPDNHVGFNPTGTKPAVIDVIDFNTRYTTNRFLPAFDSEAEAVQYMNGMAGLELANQTWIDATLEKYQIAAKAIKKPHTEITRADMPSKVVLSSGADSSDFTYGSFRVALDHSRTLLDGSKIAYVPENILDHTTSVQCVYMSEGTAVDAASVSVTNNLSEIDAKSFGVKELKYTAKVGETVVGTKTIKVVVAPKYERTWVAGRVSTLKAFHLNGALYANYQYNYTAKTVKVTFYELDGVTVASTTEIPL